MEWWVYAILVILFIGLVQPEREPPRPSQSDAERLKGGKVERKPAPRLALGLRWKRNPGNLWERERRQNHPLEPRSD